MKIINQQLLSDDNVVIMELPKLEKDTTVRVWSVPTEYQSNGFYISTYNDIPACDHMDPLFIGELKADETTKNMYELETTINYLTSYIQTYLDNTVKIKGYDNILSATNYVNSTNTNYKADSIAAILWRDNVWMKFYSLINEIKEGTTAMVTPEELVILLPKLEW